MSTANTMPYLCVFHKGIVNSLKKFGAFLEHSLSCLMGDIDYKSAKTIKTMSKPRLTRASAISPVILGATFVILSLPSGGTYPQPCRFPRQYEGFRFQSSYFEVADDYVAVDCDRGLMYTRSVKSEDENVFTIIDLGTNMMHLFNPGRECIKAGLHPFEVIDYCETSRDASFTGEVSLEGNNRQGWVTTNPQNYEQTSVVTRISKNTEGCLPFVFRVRSDKHTLMANTLYDVKLGISDQKALDRLNVDISDCVLYDNSISG